MWHLNIACLILVALTSVIKAKECHPPSDFQATFEKCDKDNSNTEDKAKCTFGKFGMLNQTTMNVTFAPLENYLKQEWAKDKHAPSSDKQKETVSILHTAFDKRDREVNKKVASEQAKTTRLFSQYRAELRNKSVGCLPAVEQNNNDNESSEEHKAVVMHIMSCPPNRCGKYCQVDVSNSHYFDGSWYKLERSEKGNGIEVTQNVENICNKFGMRPAMITSMQISQFLQKALDFSINDKYAVFGLANIEQTGSCNPASFTWVAVNKTLPTYTDSNGAYYTNWDKSYMQECQTWTENKVELTPFSKIDNPNVVLDSHTFQWAVGMLYPTSVICQFDHSWDD